MKEAAEPPKLPTQSPLFYAQNEQRYARQQQIREYQELHDCRLVVMIDAIFPDVVVLFEELLYTAKPEQNLHLLLSSPGGDGETAVRLARAAQARCNELTVIVPDQAKSAATLMAMGAHCILMGPTSDLGPVDPQFQLANGQLVSAKNIIAAVEDAETRVVERPDTYALHAALLADVSALMVQNARAALARTEDLVKEALRSHPARDERTVTKLVKALREPLIELPASHGAVFGADDAHKAGLPVEQADPHSHQWQLLWRLYMKYVALGIMPGVMPGGFAYEGECASQVRAAPRPPTAAYSNAQQQGPENSAWLGHQ
ncbi:MAG: SDH family Clp fold serine proteinase [Pseudonocardiaceae bacterium]